MGLVLRQSRVVLGLSTVLWVSFFGLAAIAPAMAAPAEGKIENAGGTVFIRRGPQGAWQRLSSPKNTLLRPGDGLRTGDKSHVRLLIGEGRFIIGPNSTVEIVERHRRPVWRLILGRIAAFFYGKSQSTFEVGASEAAAAGTHFQLIHAEDGTVTLMVIEGMVDLKNPLGAVRVMAGQESVASPGEAPRPPVATDLSGAIAWEAALEAISLPFEFPISRLSDPENALKSFQASHRPEDWVLAGDILLGQRKLPEAESLYRRALEADPSLVRGWAHLGFLHLTGGEIASIQEDVERAIALAPTDPEALTARGAFLLTKRRPQEALEALRQAATSGSPAAQTFLGLVDLRQGRLEEARAALNDALRSDPRAYVARSYLSILELLTGRLKAAEREARDALEIAPDSGLAQQAMATALFYQGRVKEAAGFGREAARLNPSLAGAHLTLARIHTAEGRIEEGVSEAIRGVSLDPDDPYAQSTLGSLLLAVDDLPHAENAFRRALQLAPEVSFVRSGLGATLTRQQRFREALSHLQAAVALDAGSAPAQNNLGSLYAMQGRLSEAEKAFQEAIRLQPGWGMPHGNLALVHLERNEIAEAIAEGEKAVRLGERSAILHTVLARIYLKQGRLDRALDELRLAEAEDPVHPLTLFLESDIFRRKDRSRDALRATVQGVAFDPGAISELRLYNRVETIGSGSDQQSRSANFQANGRGDRGRSALYTNSLLEDNDGYRSANGNRLDRFGQGIFGYRPDYRSQSALSFSVLNLKSGLPGRQTGARVEDPDYRSHFLGWQADLTHRRSVGKRDFLLIRLGGGHRELVDTNPDSLQSNPLDPKPFRRLEIASDTPTLEVRWDRDLLSGRRLVLGGALQNEKRSLNGLLGLIEIRQGSPEVTWIQISQRDTPRRGSSYLEYRFPVSERLQAAVGGYAGKQTRFDSVALPKARLQYNAPDGGRYVLLMQPIFRADATVLSPVESWSNPQPIEPGQVSDDGSVLSYEAHYERPGRNGSFYKTSLYWREAKGLFVDVEDPQQAPVASRAFFPKARLIGAEAAYEIGPGTPLAARLWARYEEAKDRGTGERLLPYHPRWQGGARLDYLDRRGWRIGLEFVGFGRRFDDTANTISLPGQMLTHLRILKQQGIWQAYFVEIRNLFDRKYEYWRGYPAQRRVFRMGVERRL